MPKQNKQRYRYTFKCSEHGVFKKISTKPNLETSTCPDCKKQDEVNKIIRMQDIGDGAVSNDDLKPPVFQKAPNVVYQCDGCSEKIRLYQEAGSGLLKACTNCDSQNIHLVCHLDRTIGSNAKIQNKAIDETAKICMEDYNLTNLKDNVRMGDTIAPRLASKLQQKADTFFAGGPKANSNNKTARFMNNLGRSAIKGAFRPERTGTPNMIKKMHENQSGMKAQIITAGERRL
jgi:hypothetical protein